MLEKRRPVRATIGGLPDAPGDRAEVVGIRFAGDSLDRQRAAAPEWADQPPFHLPEELFIDLPRGTCRGWW